MRPVWRYVWVQISEISWKPFEIEQSKSGPVPGAGFATGRQTGDFLPPLVIRREDLRRDGAKPNP